MLKIKLFGSPQVFMDDRSVEIPRAKAVALLAYLAASGQPHTRDSLATMFWPEHSQSAARTGLRRMLYLIRQGIGERPLLTDRRQVGLHFDASLWVDVLAFKQAAEAARADHPADQPLSDSSVRQLSEAVSLYSAPLLEGFTLKDAPQFDAWHYFMADSVEHLLADALQRLVQWHAAREGYSEAIGYARRWLSLDPLHEAAHRQLMQLYAESGQTSAAVRQYQYCAETLELELGVEPEEATQALLAAIESRSVTPSAPSVHLAPKIDWGDVPDVGLFYGRQSEMAQLEQWLLTDRCRMVAILGMGGMGKTTLTARLARKLSDSIGEDVAEEAGGNGRLPFQRIIWRSLLNAPPLSDLLPEWLQFLSVQQLAQMPTNLDQALGLLLTYLREARCLLILDNMESILQGDGQKAGSYLPGYEDYGQLIRRLGQSQHQSCLLITSREKPNGFRRLEGDFPAVRSLPLQGLSVSVGQVFLEGRGVEGQSALTQTIVERYSGNPLALKLVAETIQDLFAGDLSQFLADEAPIFDDIRVVLEEHFSRLSALEREILFWLMVEREPIRAEQLQANLVEKPTRRQFLEALRSLRRRSLLVQTSRGGEVKFALQNVIAEYAIEQFIEQICAELEKESADLLHRHPILKAQSKDFVRESQKRLIVTPIGERLIAREGKASLRERVERLVQHFRERFPKRPSYAAGSLLNLLIGAEVDLSGLNFSQLAVWQSNLTDVQLMDVDFSDAHLAGTVFKESFFIISSAQYSPDGLAIAAGSNDGIVRMWRANDFHPLATFEGHSNTVSAIDFHPNGNILASASVDQTICLWDLDSGQTRQTLIGHSDVIMAVVFDKAGQLLATAGHDPAIRLWDWQTGECVALLEGHHGSILGLCFDPNGRFLYSGGADKTIRVWDVASGQCEAVLQGHRNRIWSLVVSADGQTLYSSGDESPIYVWDLAERTLKEQLQGHRGGVRTLALSHDNQLLASGGFDKAVRVWSVKSGKNIRTMTNHLNALSVVDFSPDGQRLVCGTPGPSVRVWDVETGQSLRTLRGTISGITAVSLGPDGDTLISGSNNGEIRLWSIEEGRQTRLLAGHWGRIRELVISADGLHAVSCSTDKTVRLWQIDNGRCLWTSDEHQFAPRTVALSGNGRLVASAGEGRRIRLLDAQTGHTKELLTGHIHAIMTLTFSPDGRRLFSSDSRQNIFVWDVESGELIEQVDGEDDWAFPVVFQAEQQFVAHSGEDKQIHVQQIGQPQPLVSLVGHTDWLLSIAWSPDGVRLASGGVDQAVRIWEVENGRCLHTLHGHLDRVWMVAFSKDGQQVVSCSADETIRLWDVQSGDCLLTLAVERPYERLNIAGVTGITDAQKATLRALGAVD